MSTDGTPLTTRRGRTRRRRGRAFAIGFALVVGVLSVVSLAGAAGIMAQGPRVTDVQIDPVAAVQASGSRLILTTTQSLTPVDASQVTVTPATPFTVDTSGRSVGVRFVLPLHDATDYTVTIAGLKGVGGGPTGSVTQSFSTPPVDIYVLRRAAQADTIFRTDLAGQTAVPVFSNPHIEDFRATASHLVVSVRTGDGTAAGGAAALIVTDLNGGAQRELPLPGTGFVTNLQSADRGELIGYTYSDASLNATSGLESALFTASLKDSAADNAPTPVAVAGGDVRVSEWRFVPDTSSILLLAFDGRLLLTDSTGADPVSLGNAMSIDGIARGSSQAVVLRPNGRFVVDLTNGAETALVDPSADLGRVAAVTPLPGSDAGTVRIINKIQGGVTVLGTTVAVVGADGTTTPVFSSPPEDALLQTCVSPSGRYVAILVAPAVVDNRFDAYQLPLPGRLDTHIVDLSTGAETVNVTGFDASWCQIPPK
ncbi:hypothetical protein [Microbacterium rhizomatis]|uniref:SbsA Ig-like domain-containing protein n=1 Tax=Microbacterium rhizomatis TaxID=1631477 RepID=A0A5J5J1Q5_9MICO|nr:hypothetical protein [Microbacterium rhizomatis]KAA9108415.1 hypothetical protein F6B43_13640 [Microbacterium rhizomatis]